MYFAVITRDKSHVSALRLRLRPEHRAWLRAHEGHPVEVRLGGPLLDGRGDMDGTLLVVEADDQQAVWDFLQEDPYVRHDMFAHIEVRQWQWSLGQPLTEKRETQ